MTTSKINSLEFFNSIEANINESAFYFTAYKNNSLEFLYVFVCYNTTSNERIYFGRAFDQNLALVLEKKIRFNFNSVSIYNEKIYCLFDSNGHTLLKVYDEKLNEIERYGQSNENLPFCFSNKILQLLVNENYYILFQGSGDDFNIIIMDRNNGNIMKTFKTDLEYINLYMDRYILNFDFETLVGAYKKLG